MRTLRTENIPGSFPADRGESGRVGCTPFPRPHSLLPPFTDLSKAITLSRSKMGVGMKGAIVFSLWLVTEVVTSTDTDKLRCSKLRRVADEFCSTTGVDSQTCSRVKELYQSRCVAVASSQISSATDGRSLQMSKELESCRADVRRLHSLGTEIGSLGSSRHVRERRSGHVSLHVVCRWACRGCLSHSSGVLNSALECLERASLIASTCCACFIFLLLMSFPHFDAGY